MNPPTPVSGRPTRLTVGQVQTLNADGTVDVKPEQSRAMKVAVPVVTTVAPTIGQRVLLADIDGDAQKPVVLGCLTGPPAGGGATVVDASDTAKGITKLSVAPAASSVPIALGANDVTVERTTSKGAANGYASLDAAAKVPVAQLPAIAESQVTNLTGDLAAKEAVANKGAANGYAPLDASSKVPAANSQVASVAGRTGNVTLAVGDVSGAEAVANKGAANGYAPLDANARVPQANLPSRAFALAMGD